ncbi:MAG TPA: glutaredoxin [Epulopiscium sp.]|nr:glutaredoxin [Candidatus Epulonipiscium sp.]
MKIIMYGSRICSDCVEAEAQLLKRNDIELEYRQITQDVRTMKKFLSYRDNEPMFQPVKERGQIGIPFFVLEDGSKSFEINF